MRRVHLGAVVLALASILGALVMTTTPLPRTAAQSGDAVLRVTGPDGSIKKGDKRVPFDITVQNVKDLGAFQFDLTYDAHVFDLTDAALDAEKGDFLGSSGRPVVCNPPVVDAGAGVTRFTCRTLSFPAAGVDGSGKLATVYLHAKGSGSTDITLKSARLVGVGNPALEPTDPALPQITFTTEDTSIKVIGGGGGMNWLIWGPVIVVVLVLVVGGAYAVIRMRSATTKPAAAM